MSAVSITHSQRFNHNFRDFHFALYSWLHFSRIKLSNLMLVVVPAASDSGPPLGAEAKQINYTWTRNHIFPCHKKHLNELESRRLDDCFTEDCRVSESLILISHVVGISFLCFPIHRSTRCIYARRAVKSMQPIHVRSLCYCFIFSHRFEGSSIFLPTVFQIFKS